MSSINNKDQLAVTGPAHNALADVLPAIGSPAGKLEVRLSNQIIHLLSEQMYSSPVKAVEELVVNSYDADADECRIGIATTSMRAHEYIAVFDDGTGMDFADLQALWHVGQSPKAKLDTTCTKVRKLIGKFGIGKLATHAIANRITYLSRKDGIIHHVTCDYRRFESNPTGGGAPVPLDVNKVEDLKVFRKEGLFVSICNDLGVNPDDLTNGKTQTWTICLLEDLKDKAKEVQLGRLRWVLSTAMPMRSDFKLYLNKDLIKSSKDSIKCVVRFMAHEINKNRVSDLNKKLGTNWLVRDNSLVCDDFPNGVRGEIVVSERSLVAGKSADIDRSHGFFIKVRDRLVNQNDELFGCHALSHATFNVFRADLQIDDLNSEVTAPREGIENGRKKEVITNLLVEIFNEARSRKEKAEREEEEKESRKKEHERSFVNTRLVEHPIADVLATYGTSDEGAEADESWFFMRQQDSDKVPEVVEQLYKTRTKYKYEYSSLGKTERLVKLDPSGSVFTLNEDHELVLAHSDNARARALLEEVATAEVMLEVYMREAGIDPHTIGEILGRRDMLIRGLAQDRIYSLDSIAKLLEDSADDEHNLELALVAAARALGFNAKHISGASEPDGLAKFNDYADGEKKITLEAKSSASVPQLSQLDFAGLQEHKERYGADGCLVVAPSYPGGSREDSAVDWRSGVSGVSCWTISDLARVVRNAEAYQISATQILDIVLKKHKPEDVRAAVEQLFTAPNMQGLYKDVLATLRKTGNMKNAVRTVQTISGGLAILGTEVDEGTIRRALLDISHASMGLLRLTGERIIVLGDLDEIERRVAAMTGDPGQPRRPGTFRE